MLKIIGFWILVLVIPISQAADLNVSGFGDITLTASDSEIYGYRSDVSVDEGIFKSDYDLTPYSRLGLQLDYTLNEKLDFVAQWVVMDQEEENLDGFTRMAFVRYLGDKNWALRVGRIPLNLFELTERRDAGISYSWVKVPNEVYGFVPNRSQDGFDFEYATRLGDWRTTAIFSYGKSEADFTSTNNPPIKFSDMYGLSLQLEGDSLLFKARYSEAQVSSNNQDTQIVVDGLSSLAPVWSEAQYFADQVDFQRHTVSYLSLKMDYFWNEFTLSSELAKIDSTSLLIDNLINGYVNFSYSIDDWTLYYLAGFADSDRYVFDGQVPPVPNGDQVIFFLNEINAFFRANQTSHSIGFRYDIREDLALKLQYQRFNIEDAGNGLWKLTSGFRVLGNEEKLNTLHFGLSFSF